MVNHLQKLLEIRPDEEWDWDMLSRNPNLTWEIVKNNHDKPWNWVRLSVHLGLTWENIKEDLESKNPGDWQWDILGERSDIPVDDMENPLYHWTSSIVNNECLPWETLKELLLDKDYDDVIWRHLSHNPNVTWEFVQENLDKEWDYDELGGNSNITWEIIRDNPDYPWGEFGISRNPNITWDNIREDLRSNNPKKWNWRILAETSKITLEILREYSHNWESHWYTLSHNPNLTWEIIQGIPRCKWEWYYLSKNPCITWEIVQEDLKSDYPKPWDWDGLSRNPNITWEIIQDNPNFPWDWRTLSYSSKITWKIVKNNLNKPWNWWWLSRVVDVTLEDIREYFMFWEWESLSQNQNITWEIVRDNPGFPWVWANFSLNSSITWEIVRDNPDKAWDFKAFSINRFEKHPAQIRRLELKKLDLMFSTVYYRYNNLEKGIENIIRSFLV